MIIRAAVTKSMPIWLYGAEWTPCTDLDAWLEFVVCLVDKLRSQGRDRCVLVFDSTSAEVQQAIVQKLRCLSHEHQAFLSHGKRTRCPVSLKMSLRSLTGVSSITNQRKRWQLVSWHCGKICSKSIQLNM